MGTSLGIHIKISRVCLFAELLPFQFKKQNIGHDSALFHVPSFYISVLCPILLNFCFVSYPFISVLCPILSHFCFVSYPFIFLYRVVSFYISVSCPILLHFCFVSHSFTFLFRVLSFYMLREAIGHQKCSF